MPRCYHFILFNFLGEMEFLAGASLVSSAKENASGTAQVFNELMYSTYDSSECLQLVQQEIRTTKNSSHTQMNKKMRQQHRCCVCLETLLGHTVYTLFIGIVIVYL